ncbi:hypothetical protein GUJ93_ZPchr0010g10557 [Zizania palustris]|uniref:RING-type domain-containing protein n=1 Tax=Zizania palustris TaxID=103762 RepID=A0A8J5VVT9_ZIZPA|nr:hypothetical protein GUJ93_ZPchr0010g10557 [Zizania palustris]
MLRPPTTTRRLLQSDGVSGSNPNRIPGIPPADPPSGGVSSDVVVILAALLCALICVVGLAAVARCARNRRNRAGAGSSPSNNPDDAAAHFVGGGGGGGGNAAGATGASGAGVTAATTASKGLKKKALKALPKLVYADAVAAAAAARGAVVGEEEGKVEVLAECAICLSEFGEREEVRVMPQCGHGFHVACVDTWLRTNSSCPSCRRPIVLDDPSPPKRCRKCESIVLETVIAASSSTAGGRGGVFLP